MPISNFQPYFINNEYDITQILAHFDANFIFSVIDDKLNNINYFSTLQEPNVVQSFEQNFKAMNENYPGDSANIHTIREKVYRDIIEILTRRFNLEFNTVDDTIDAYTAAFYLYEFLVSKRNDIMTHFFVSFIINNKDALYNALMNNGIKKEKNSSSNYGSVIYSDPKFILISANMVKIIECIAEMDITLLNIFQSTYIDYNLVQFLDNMVADKGNFFRDFYCEVIKNPEIAPIVVTNIKLGLQRAVGNISSDDISSLIMANNF